jgi:hypothetical protein
MSAELQQFATYMTLDRRVLDLTSLTRDELAFLAKLYDDYSRDVGWAAFANSVMGPDNPLLRATAGRVTNSVWGHPLFQALRDLEDRVGIQQGELQPQASEVAGGDPLADRWLPAAQAAADRGVTLPGLHKAIKRGDVIARTSKPGGTRLVVSANSLERWRPNRTRQAARRRTSLSETGALRRPVSPNFVQ